jgi:hypothetical protein
MDLQFDLTNLTVGDQMKMEEGYQTMPVSSTVRLLSKYMVDDNGKKVDEQKAIGIFSALTLAEMKVISNNLMNTIRETATPKSTGSE